MTIHPESRTSFMQNDARVNLQLHVYMSLVITSLVLDINNESAVPSAREFYPQLEVMGRARYAGNRDFYLALGQRIAKAREGKLTQEQLASKISLTRTSIINIEKGRQQVLVHTLCDIARAINVPMADLIPAHDDLNVLLRDASKEGRDWVISSAVKSVDKN